MIPVWVLLFLQLHLQALSSTVSDPSPSNPSPSNPSPPWKEITPPADLSGWKVCCGPAKYTVTDGVVCGTSVPGSPNTFLVTEKKWGDFELEYEFKVDSKLNSGVQIRSEVESGVMRGCQIEIDMDENRQRFWSAGIFEEGDRGWLCDLSENAPAIAAHKLDDWNQVRVVAKGALIETRLNDVFAARTWSGKRISGVIGLQVHGVSAQQKEPLQVRWRNIRIRDLGTHHWIPVEELPQQADPKKTGLGPESSILLPETVRSLRLKIDKPIQQELKIQLGDLLFEIQPKSQYAFRFPPSSEEDGLMGAFGGGTTGPSGNKALSWEDSAIYLHDGPWGSGFEITRSQGRFQTRKMALSTTPGPTSARKLTFSTPPRKPWLLEILVPKIPIKTP